MMQAMKTNGDAKMINLPVRCTVDMKPVGANDTDSGWMVARFATLDQAKQFMADYPRCFMPCWKRMANEPNVFVAR
jgi:hypothetical protein